MRGTYRTPEGPHRWLGILGRLAAAIAGPALVLAAALSAAAEAGVPAGATWQTQAPLGTHRYGRFVLDNNVLNSQAWPQTIWAVSAENWGVETAQPASTDVKSYPNVQQTFATRYSRLLGLQGSFAESMPSVPGLAADAAYTMRLTTPDNRQVQVTVRVDSQGQPAPAGTHLGAPVLWGEHQHYALYQRGPDEFTFMAESSRSSAKVVHLLSALRWLVNNHRVDKSDVLTEVDFGWQIASTGSQTVDFKLTSYSLRLHKRHLKALPHAGSVGGSLSAWAFTGGLVAVFAALFVAIILLFGRFDRASRSRTLSNMFERYGPRREPEPGTIPEVGGRVASAALGAMQRVMTTSTHDRLAKRLDLAGVTRKPAEWALFGVCLGVGLAATLSLVTSYVFIGVVAGSVAAWMAMRLSLSLRIVRRRGAFSDQLPDLLQLIASTLRAGFSLPQALDAVVKEAGQPAASEFGRAMTEARIGADLDVALEAVANRMDSDDLRWTVMAIRIQQGVGGNLAEVLLTIAGTIRERAFLRRQVKALSAEGRLSAYILVALPILVGAWLFLSAGNYMRPLYTTPFGDLLLAAAVVLLLLGAFWMNRTIKIEV